MRSRAVSIWCGPALALGTAACTLLTDTDELVSAASSGDAGADGTVVEQDARANDAFADERSDDAARDVSSPIDGPADVTASAYATAVLADQPVAYFHFEETTGSVCVDELGALTCAYAGSTVVHGLAGVVGAAARFDSTTDSVSIVPKSPDLGLAYTIEFWMMLDVSAATDGRQLFRIEELTPTRSGLRGELFATGAAFRTELWSSGVHLTYTLASSPLSGGVWHHIAHGFNPQTKTEFTYVDGVAASVGNVAVDASARPVVDTPLVFSAWTGSLDELALYDKALPPSRILAHFAVR